MIVDDTPEAVAVLEAILAKRGHRVRLVESGSAALRELERRSVSLVVLDLDLPEMHGWEVLRRLRADPRLAGTPVIIHSASAAASIPPADAVPDGIIGKGASIPELVRALERFV